MASFRCYDNSDVIETLIITNCHLYLTKLWWQFFQIFFFFFLWRRSLCSNLGGVEPEKPYRATLKGHSQLWDRANLDTTFTSFKGVHLNPNQMHASDTSRNALQSCLAFHTILDLSLKNSFWVNYHSSYNIILSCLVKHSIQRIMKSRRRAGEIAFAYQTNKRNESITLQSKLSLYISIWKLKSMEKGYMHVF